MSITPKDPADFTPSMGTYKTLQPFRYWCQKVLPLVYDDSLSYYELLCKVVDYLNKTMEDVETLNGDVEGLHTAYVQLQAYVNDYFSTLDVQQEINNKLDVMASDGTLDELLLPYFNEYKDEINGIVATQNQTLNAQNGRIIVLEGRMDTFASLPDGSTSGDAELLDIRVGADGTIYPSAGDAVRGQISDLNSDLSQLDLQYVSLVADGEIQGEVGSYKYLDYRDGRIYNYGYESYVLIASLENITSINYIFTNATPNVFGLAFFDKNGTYIANSGVQALATIQTIDVPDGATTVKATVMSAEDITVNVKAVDFAREINNNTNNLIATIHTNNTVTPTTGYYVDYRDGSVISNANFKYIEFSDLIGKTLVYKSTVAILDIRGLAFYNAYGVFIGGFRMLSSEQNITIPSDAVTCRATVNDVNEIYQIVDLQDIKDYSEKYDSMNLLNAFDNITCIGDSLTYSQVYLNNDTRQAYHTYPDILAERTGVNVEAIANPGYSASQWWSVNKDAITTKTNQLAIVYLGTNLGLSDTLDTDCVGDDPDLWNSTLTADYARIVNKLKSVNAKIILVQCFYTTGSLTKDLVATNNAIKSIADRFGCGLIPSIYLSKFAYHKLPDSNAETIVVKVHYNDLGYSAFVDKLIEAIGNMDNEYMLNIVPN